MTDAAPRVVVMGVSASGKSTVARALAAELLVPFVDADDLHPASNVEKMTAGVPLDDADRVPWLAGVAGAMAVEPGIVVACSALKRSYRDQLRAGAPGVVFVHLAGSRAVLDQRARGRIGHFMPAALLDSQLAALEPLGADEPGIVLDIAEPTEALVAAASDWVRARTD